MLMGWPISVAFFSAALITRRASSNFTAVMGTPCYVLFGRLFGKLSFGLKPILRLIARLFSALQVNLVCAIPYFLLTR
jgi:hypothetical protein